MLEIIKINYKVRWQIVKFWAGEKPHSPAIFFTFILFLISHRQVSTSGVIFNEISNLKEFIFWAVAICSSVCEFVGSFFICSKCDWFFFVMRANKNHLHMFTYIKLLVNVCVWTGTPKLLTNIHLCRLANTLLRKRVLKRVGGKATRAHGKSNFLMLKFWT